MIEVNLCSYPGKEKQNVISGRRTKRPHIFYNKTLRRNLEIDIQEELDTCQ